jgi:hypothetical protein
VPPEGLPLQGEEVNALHLLLLLGSPFLGLEALLMGLGGGALTSYRRSRGRTLLLILLSGLAISCAALATGEAVGLPGPATVALLLLYLPLAGKLLSLLRPSPPRRPLPEELSTEGLEELVRRRYGKLLRPTPPDRRGDRRARGSRRGGSRASP